MIELDLTEDKARLLWCQGIRARKMMRQAIRDENPVLMAYAFGWLDYIFDAISKSVSSGIALGPGGLPINPENGEEIDGSETNKP